MVDRHITVGIIDDEALIARALERILVGIGYTVTALAHTVEDGIALVERTDACDLVFIDLFLDGRAAGVEIAQRAARNGLDVVIMTGAPTLPDGLPGAALLLKPFSSDQVLTLLRSLGPAEAPVAAPRPPDPQDRARPRQRRRLR